MKGAYLEIANVNELESNLDKDHSPEVKLKGHRANEYLIEEKWKIRLVENS